MNPAAQTALNSPVDMPLQGLHDIHLPLGPDLWPLAPGWWLVIALSVLTSVLITVYWWRKRRWQQYILAQIDAEITKPDSDLSQQLAGLSAILRRAALKRYPREQVASLHGQQWLDFLEKTSHARHFERTVIQPLAEGMYQPASGSTLLSKDDPLVQFIIRWIQENLS